MENINDFTEEEQEYFKTFPVVLDGIAYDLSDLFLEES